ncbi:PDZ domain-containing protein [bacterium]|nr:PDZ domain-containing protein [bacterium]
MNHWRTILALLACLALLGAATALADETERTVKVVSFAEDDGEPKEMKVEIVEVDGESHVKIWSVVDGEEELIKEYDADDEEGIIKLEDGKYCIVMDDEGKDCHFKFHGDKAFFDDDENVFFMSGDDDVSWVGQGGAYLGVQLSGLSDDQAEYFDVDDGEGALVTEVVEDSPAEAAGFRIYDVITKIAGDEVEGPDDVIEAVGGREEGDEVEIVVLRKGKNQTLKATLAEREADTWAYALDNVPGRVLERLHGRGGNFPLKWHQLDRLTPHPPVDQDELDNLRADIEELRAMLEELKADK